MGKIGEKVRKTLESLFHHDADQAPQPPPAELEDVEFPDEEGGDVPNQDLVVDFGTSATVVATVVIQPNGRADLHFLVGDPEHSSELLLTPDMDRVLAVGAKAWTTYQENPSTTGLRYFTSLKRYLELLSRKSADAPSRLVPSQVVRQLLVASLKGKFEQYRDANPDFLGKASRIVVSVPNSFNALAVKYVADGVRSALEELLGAEEINANRIRIIRESEAVGYAVLRHKELASMPTGRRDTSPVPFEWMQLDAPQVRANLEMSAGDQFLVLDIGGGTTDLSLFEVDKSDPQRGHVLMNSGLPIGGTDIDKLILFANLGRQGAQDLTAWPDRLRYGRLWNIRTRKDSTSGKFFFDNPGDDEEHADRIIEDEILKEVPIEDTVPPGSETRYDYMRRRAKGRLDQLISMSIHGLFKLIPEEAKIALKAIVLTGRGSQLEAIQEAVMRAAHDLSVPAYSLRSPYHRKLAVACGSTLARMEDFTGDRLPCGTLGKRVAISNGGPQIESDFPISGDEPTIWRALLPRRPGKEIPYDWWEYRTHIEDDLLNQLGSENIMLLGFVRRAARSTVRGDTGEDGKQEALVMWHPGSEAYYSIREGRWVEHRLSGSRPTDLNCLTGFPLGFPVDPAPKDKIDEAAHE
jgi:hypothetical protein